MPWLVAAGAVALCGCGGRAAARAATSAEPPPIADWERPPRMGDAKPAVRLDRPSAADQDASCENGCADGAAGASGAPGAGGLRVSLDRGMTLYSLARTYGVPLQTLMRVNGISDPTTIRAGTEIYIPGTPGGDGPPATTPRTARTRKKGSPADAARPGPGRAAPPALLDIAWPLDGRITGSFGARGRHHHHDGIDIDGTRGEEIRAVAAGIVVRSGSDGKYGKTVVIDHGDGVTTLYAHASRVLVEEGDRVDQGEAIAEVGASGNARGTHLHFEVRRAGRPVDPLPYLKPGMMGAGR